MAEVTPALPEDPSQDIADTLAKRQKAPSAPSLPADPFITAQDVEAVQDPGLMSPQEFRQERRRLGYFILGAEPTVGTSLIDMDSRKGLGEVIAVEPDSERGKNHFKVTTVLGTFTGYYLKS